MTPPAARLDRRELLVVAVVLAVAAALRLWRLDLGWFGLDQARDIQTALDIVAGREWPTVGPTMRRVTSLGALYYYFWALPHVVSRDPLAAYRFAAVLGILAVVVVWALARRLWGPRAALVAAIVLATSPVAIIDARVAWAPAALPCIAALLLWLMLGRPGDASSWWGGQAARRLALLGAALGLALQLHLTMAAWLVAATLLVVLHPPGRRPLAAGLGALLLVGFPAAWAVYANAGHDAGVASLPARGPFPDVVGRLAAAAALTWRVPSAFWQWSDAADVWSAWARGAAIAVNALALLGGARLLLAATAGARVAGILVMVATAQVGMVALLPGEAWYYYLDAALPLWALAAGALAAPTLRDEAGPSPGRAETAGGTSPAFTLVSHPGALALPVVIVAGAILTLHTSAWLATIARHGYLVLDPSPLTLDGGGGRDAAAPGRLLTLGSKRAVAAAVASEPAPFAVRWRATHGPAFDDATGDNGFWLSRAAPAPEAEAEAEAPAAVTHAALWYRDDPGAPIAPAAGGDLVTAGPLVIARQRPTVLYEQCRSDAGTVAVPIRVTPDPRRYGDGTTVRASHLPARLACAIAAGSGGTRVVAAVTAGTVTVRAADGAAGAAGRESTLCLGRGDRPTPFTIEIVPPASGAADLDLYERPDPACTAGKIAP